MEINKIYFADIFEFLYRLDDNVIDLAIADPPYNLHVEDWDKFADESEYNAFMTRWLDMLLPKLKHSASIYIFNSAYNSAATLLHLKSRNMVYKNWIVWYKKDGFSACRKKYATTQETILFFSKSEKYTFNFDAIRQPYLSTERMQHAAKKGILKNGKRWFPNDNGKLCGDVWEITSQRHKEKKNGKVQKLAHPTQKPFEMVERMIKASSNENDLVLDLFSGAGTASLAAKAHNRRYIGCENNQAYIENAENMGLQIGRL